MNTMFKILSFSWSDALGLTLLHSLWQGAVIASLAIATLRFIPSRFSGVRYLLATTAMLTVLLSAIATFIFFSASSSFTALKTITFQETADAAAHHREVQSFIQQCNVYIENNISILVNFWMMGAFFFTMRLAGSWWYVNKIKNEAVILEGDWAERLATLAAQLNLNRIVHLAESHAISAPVVIGYLKPVVLIPVGMLSGLTTEQIEAIFIHELSHITRHDYLINFFQALIEALFFFNPFVWVLSGVMRREREHCCDDAVVSRGKNVKAYVYALAHLEQEKLSKAGLALSLATHRMELLNRIKRIMEKSVKQYTGREKIIPALLVIIGLICASWLTLKSTDTSSQLSYDADHTVLQDTTKKKKQKSATYSRKKIVTTGPDGKPHEEIVENFEGDESLRPLMVNPDVNFDIDFDQIVPSIPDFDVVIPAIPPIDFNLDVDGSRHRDWQNLFEQFSKKFNGNADDFSEKNLQELQRMMEELEKNMESNFSDEWFKKMDEFSRKHQRHEQHRKDMMFNEDGWRQQEEQLQKFHESMKHFNEDHFKHIEKDMKDLEVSLQLFQQELKKELLNDGYLKKGEKIESMRWDENGDIEVNGIKIRKSHDDKYRQLHRKYFKEKGNFRFVE